MTPRHATTHELCVSATRYMQNRAPRAIGCHTQASREAAAPWPQADGTPRPIVPRRRDNLHGCRVPEVPKISEHIGNCKRA
jgi:hypothetical protein